MSMVNEIRRTIHRFFNDEGASPFGLRRQFAETWPNRWPQYTVIVLSITFSLALAGCGRSHAAMQLPTPEVLVATPVQQDVPVHGEWVAMLDGYVNAEIRPQVSGYIISQNYKEGSVVRKGQVLFEIDPRPFQAALDRAKGELAQAEALLAKSNNDVERDTPLAEKKAVPKEKLDNEIQAKLAAQAAVQSATAAVERAQLDLGWTKVTSLVDGVAGICEVQMGNLVGPNSTSLLFRRSIPSKFISQSANRSICGRSTSVPADSQWICSTAHRS